MSRPVQGTLLLSLQVSSRAVDLSKHLVVAISSQAWERSFFTVYDFAISIIL